MFVKEIPFQTSAFDNLKIGSYKQPHVRQIQVNSAECLVLTYSDNSMVVLDQTSKQMLCAIGGTFAATDLLWISGQSFVTATKSGLTLWQMDQSLTRALWQYKVIHTQGEPFGLSLESNEVVIAMQNGAIQKFNTETDQLSVPV